MIKYFQPLWKLVRDLLSSTAAMMSTVALIAITLYTAACFAVEIIAKDGMLRSIPETKYIIDEHISSIEIVMMSFLQLVTVDSIAAIYWPLVKHRKWLFFYFAIVIVIVSIALMNLVTANLVEAALKCSQRDREMELYRLRHLRPDVLKAFWLMDKNEDGFLTRQEIIHCHTALPAQILAIVPQESLFELFDILDEDDSGTVSEQEFIDGVEQLVLSNVSFKDMHQLRVLSQIKVKQDLCFTELMCMQRRLTHLNLDFEHLNLDFKHLNLIKVDAV